MQNIAIEIANVDDDLAEQAVQTATRVLSTMIPVKSDTLFSEPHSDVRGIWAHVLMDDPDDMSPSFHKYVISAYKALIQLHLQQVGSVVIHIMMNKEEGK